VRGSTRIGEGRRSHKRGSILFLRIEVSLLAIRRNLERSLQSQCESRCGLPKVRKFWASALLGAPQRVQGGKRIFELGNCHTTGTVEQTYCPSSSESGPKTETAKTAIQCRTMPGVPIHYVRTGSVLQTSSETGVGTCSFQVLNDSPPIKHLL